MTRHRRAAHHFVIIHGPWQDSWWWRPTAASLARRGHRCLVPDLPGCKPNDPTSDTTTVRAMADTVTNRILSDPALTDVTLVAHSFGGLIAQQVLTAVPDHIRAVIFADAWVAADGSSDERLVDLLPPGLRHLGLAAELGQPVVMSQAAWFAIWAPDASRVGRIEGGARVAATACPPDWLTAHLDWQPFWELMARRPFRVHCLQMRDDLVMPPELRSEMALRLQPTRTLVVDDSSHQGFHAHPDRFAAGLVELSA